MILPLHLEGLDNPGEDASANADVTSEWALLVNVVAVDGL